MHSSDWPENWRVCVFVWSAVLVPPLPMGQAVLRLFPHVEGHYRIAFLVLENNVDRLSAGQY
jgi:hypothetical protein